MRDPKRIARINGKLRQIWESYPDLRFFQLLTNTHIIGKPVFDYGDIENTIDTVVGIEDPYHIEDDQLEAALDEVIAHGFLPKT